jgi:hypothetical protein
MSTSQEKIKKEIKGGQEEIKPSDNDETNSTAAPAIKPVDWSPENEKIVVFIFTCMVYNSSHYIFNN